MSSLKALLCLCLPRVALIHTAGTFQVRTRLPHPPIPEQYWGWRVTVWAVTVTLREGTKGPSHGNDERLQVVHTGSPGA